MNFFKANSKLKRKSKNTKDGISICNLNFIYKYKKKH